MNIIKLDVDSKILGKKVYQVNDIMDAKKFLEEEPSIISKFNPFYLQCIIEASDLNTIHTMEDAGFRFVEFRFKKLLDINSFNRVNEFVFFPYILKPITEEADFQEALQLVKESKPDDRFSVDPFIPVKLAQKRLLGYLKMSLDNSPEEFIYGLYNKNNNELLAIKSGKILNRSEVFFYHTAIQKKLDLEKFIYMLDALIISQFTESNIHSFYTVTSGFNLMEMDLHISDLKFRIVSASVMLRKIY